MMTKNPMQLKAFIKNKAAEKHISAQLVMQNYMLERLLERTTQKRGSRRILWRKSLGSSMNNNQTDSVYIVLGLFG